MFHWKNNLFFKAAVFFLVIFCIVMIVTLQLEYNSLRIKRDSLASRVQDVSDRIEIIQSALDTPFDDDYVIKIAREKLNLRLPEEIVFFNDLSK